MNRPAGSGPEILAPAGSPDALTAAVRAGADAVYLGASVFNARQGARNFDTAALREAVSYCHARGVAVHLTLNTLVRQEELPAALAVAEEACALGIDALIVQDVGLARRLRAAAPAMPLHASTQLSCHTPAGVRLLRDAGFSRVVLAREMTREEIAACAGQDCELEVFVHGALCMCVSGQCYLSAMLGGRSGNRGLCAQPCRLPFTHASRQAAEGETALSLRDLSLWPYIEELSSAGVTSFKIEGRMKRPEYVAAAVAVCRAAARGESPSPALVQDLQSVFSRSGFTDGYYKGVRDRSLFGARRKEDVTAAGPVLGRLARLYDKERPAIPVTLDLTVTREQTALEAADGRCTVRVEGDGAQPAVNRPLDEARAAEQLSKTGGTPFCAPAIRCHIGEGLAVPVSRLNALRREALDTLLTKRAERTPIPFDAHARPAVLPDRQTAGQPRFVARLAAVEQLPGAQAADDVILPLFTPADKLQQAAGDGRLGVEIPRGLFGREQEVRRALHAAKEAGARFALCGNAGALPLALEAGLPPVGGFGLNLVNEDALAFYAERGLAAATLSMELTFRQTAHIAHRPIPTGLLLYGRQPLMLCRACPHRAAAGGCGKRGSCGLTDRKGVRFPLACDGGCTELLNAVPLYWADKREEIPPLDFWLFHFTTETPDEAAAILRDYRSGAATAPAGITRGLYRRGVE